MDLEDIISSVKCQIKKNTVCYHLYVESKKIKQTNVYNKIETDTQIQKTSQYIAKGSGKMRE